MPSIQPTRKWVVEGGEGAGEEMASKHYPATRSLLYCLPRGWEGLNRTWYSRSPWPEASANQRERHCLDNLSRKA